MIDMMEEYIALPAALLCLIGGIILLRVWHFSKNGARSTEPEAKPRFRRVRPRKSVMCSKRFVRGVLDPLVFALFLLPGCLARDGDTWFDHLFGVLDAIVIVFNIISAVHTLGRLIRVERRLRKAG